MNKTDSIAELAKALAKAQGEIENASEHRQVAKEASENALHYGEELLKMIGE